MPQFYTAKQNVRFLIEHILLYKINTHRISFNSYLVVLNLCRTSFANAPTQTMKNHFHLIVLILCEKILTNAPPVNCQARLFPLSSQLFPKKPYHCSDKKLSSKASTSSFSPSAQQSLPLIHQ